MPLSFPFPVLGAHATLEALGTPPAWRGAIEPRDRLEAGLRSSPPAANTSPFTSYHAGFCGQRTYGRRWARPMSAVRHSRLLQNPLTQLGPRAKKISGRYSTLPCTPKWATPRVSLGDSTKASRGLARTRNIV